MRTLTVYGSRTCSPCHALKRELEKAGVEYEYKELTEDYIGDIKSIPCSVVHDEGKEIARIFGNQASKIMEALRSG